jgi:glycosyltransferase involved in cell wall biosynthesis
MPFSEKKIAIVSHVFLDGPSQALLKYLNGTKIKNTIFIGHPLLPKPGEKNISYLQLFRRGRKIKEKSKENIAQRFSLHYLVNFFQSIFWIISTNKHWDIYIGVNNLNALSGIILRRLGKVNKVVYYVVDYAPRRFDNRLQNYIYHLADRLAVTYSNEIWNLSPRMNKARVKYKNLEVNENKCKVVPMGVWLDRTKKATWGNVNRHQLVFMGHLLKKQGVQLVIEAIPEIVKKIKDFNFLIIGFGEYEPELRKKISQLKIERHVQFSKQILGYREREYAISKCGCAVALYEKGDYERNFTYYADPGKIKEYLGAGVPIIMTDVPHNAYEIEKAGCGLVVEDNKDSLVKAIIKILKDEKRLKEYRRNALEYIERFDWTRIFPRAFNES